VPAATVRLAPTTGESDRGYDFAAQVQGFHLFLEVLGNVGQPRLAERWDGVERSAKKKGVSVLVVPYMTEPGRTFCAEHGINWLDLSGNADLRGPGLRIHVSGRPNQFPHRGRPSSVFERRSSRLIRHLLIAPGRDWSVREGARGSGLNEGHVSRIVARLLDDHLVVRTEGRRFRVHDPLLLLDAWREAADFRGHRVLKGHVAARSGDELLGLMAHKLPTLQMEYAATGLAAAWAYDHFATFRLTTLYVREWPALDALEALGFRGESPGANLWLVLPNDDGVFEGGREVDGLRCVHPVQVYVDLKDQPERAAEAAEHLKASPHLLGDANAE
jgi:hypothetical protein